MLNSSAVRDTVISNCSNVVEDISMYIYSSSRVQPYVYVCTHKITNQFYIGYREKNVKLNLPSNVDLPLYKTSSKIIKSNFENYNWIIIAEFNNGNDAYDFEQQLIFENWDNPLLINNNCRYNSKNRFKSGMLGKTHTTKNKEIFSANRKGKTYEEVYGIERSMETKKKLSIAGRNKKMPPSAIEKIKIGRAKQVITDKTKEKLRKKAIKQWQTQSRILPEEHKQKIGAANTGKVRTQEMRDNQSKKMKGRTPWNKRSK
jgi:hypothetical protein